ncbi:MAG: D-cysteine desulfhydrase, partial [Woeseia sp.]
PKIYLKRDDCTGLGTGGNKARKLEFVMADALQQQADTVITLGAVQSNHARQTAAAAAKLGLGCTLLSQHRVPISDNDYLRSGNVYLDELFGATIRDLPADADMELELKKAAEELERLGKTPYVIPVGGSTPLGSLGYVDCASELLSQASSAAIAISHVVLATGSGGTQAGILAGLRASGNQIPVVGIAVGAKQEEQEQKVWPIAEATAELLQAPNCVGRSDVVVDSGYIGKSYGLPTEAMREAVLLAARLEGVLFDPVYSGKALAGLIDYIRKGRFDRDSAVVFLHTGGSAGLFAYRERLGCRDDQTGVLPTNASSSVAPATGGA